MFTERVYVCVYIHSTSIYYYYYYILFQTKNKLKIENDSFRVTR